MKSYEKKFSICFIISAAALVFPGNKDTLNTSAEVLAVKINQVINIDGILNEETWNIIPPVTQFIQRVPDEGDPFNSGSSYIPGLGADIKLGLGTSPHLFFRKV